MGDGYAPAADPAIQDNLTIQRRRKAESIYADSAFISGIPELVDLTPGLLISGFPSSPFFPQLLPTLHLYSFRYFPS